MGKASDTVYEIRICGLLPVCRGLNQPETLAKRFHGSGMLVQMQSGKGEDRGADLRMGNGAQTHRVLHAANCAKHVGPTYRRLANLPGGEN
jgi:hypothetical protein